MNLRVADITSDSIVDGPGLRMTVFTQGCPFACEGCHNQSAWDPEGGTPWELDTLVALFLRNPLQAGITLSGGEPVLQAEACAELAARIQALHKNVWTYTGNTFEELLLQGDPHVLRLLQNTDVLVDGPFLLAERTLELAYRGSRNQRLLNARASLAAGEPVSYQLPSWL